MNSEASKFTEKQLRLSVLAAVVIIVAVMAFVLVYAYMPNQALKVQRIAEKRNDPFAWAGMAQELEEKGDLIDAERAYRKAIQLKADYKSAWLGLGRILVKQGKGTDAKAAFRRADELNTDSQK